MVQNLSTRTPATQFYHFFEQQAVVFLRILNELPPTELPDVIEDFFRLLTDAIRYYPEQAICSQLAEPIFQASLTALTLQQVDPLIATLHYLRDLLSFGTDKPMISAFDGPDGKPAASLPQGADSCQAACCSPWINTSSAGSNRDDVQLSRRLLRGCFINPACPFCDYATTGRAMGTGNHSTVATRHAEASRSQQN